jgi:hypothetical protein
MQRKTDYAYPLYVASDVTKIARKLVVHFARQSLSATALMLVLAASTRAKDTGYVFVSHEKTNNIAVIDPRQDYGRQLRSALPQM